MPQPQTSPEVLAQWNYEPDLWRDFLEYESTIYKGSVRLAKHLFFGVLVLTIVIVIPLVIIPTLIFDQWTIDALGPAIALAFAGGIFLVLTAAFWIYRRERWRRLNERTGEVVISLDGVKTNGISFNWSLGEFGLSFNKVERKTVSVSPGKSFEILEFYIVNHTTSGEGRTRENFECRVPIPFGKVAEAENIMARLRTSLVSAEQEWIKKHFALGHDFSLSICRRCGDTLTESTFFSLIKCRG